MSALSETKISGRILLALLIVAPLPIWLGSADLAEVFKGLGKYLQFIAKSTALTGMASYILMPVLAMRHPLMERVFGSLDGIYALHKRLAKLSILLIVLHPIFLAAAALVDSNIGRGVWAWNSWVVWLGVLTLVAMLGLLAFSIYSHVTHRHWIQVHRFFGWLIVPSIFHALLAGKVVASNSVMLAYFSILGAIGFSAFLYRSVFGKLMVKKYPYEVVEVYSKHGHVTELVLKPTSSVSFRYRPGQFAYLSLLSPHVDDEAHPYTISTAPNGPYIRFAIKKLGDYTGELEKIEPGTKAYIEGPYGDFTRGISKQKKQVWIAGGIGITPFLSVARSIIDKKNLNIHLFYAMDKIADATFLEELFDIKGETRGNFHYTLVTSEHSGRITPELLGSTIPDLTQREFFICGPPGMMKAMRSHLHNLGVPESQVHTEEFSY